MLHKRLVAIVATLGLLAAYAPVYAAPETVTDRTVGRILLQVQSFGEAWYVDPVTRERYYLPHGDAASFALPVFGLGITNADLAKIPIGLDDRFELADLDNDNLPDRIEDALGTSTSDTDSDNDGYSDGAEVAGGFSPLDTAKYAVDSSLVERLHGRIVLQVEEHGEAWYINPVDGKRYYLSNGDVAYQIMRFLSLGITDADLATIDVGVLKSASTEECLSAACAKSLIGSGRGATVTTDAGVALFGIELVMTFEHSYFGEVESQYAYLWNAVPRNISYNVTDSIEEALLEELGSQEKVDEYFADLQQELDDRFRDRSIVCMVDDATALESIIDDVSSMVTNGDPMFGDLVGSEESDDAGDEIGRHCSFSGTTNGEADND